MELQKNKKIRGTTRRYATKVQKDIQDLLKDFDPTKLNKLKSLKLSLLDRLSNLKELDDKILLQVNDDEIEHEIFEAASFSDGLKEILVDIDFVLAENEAESGSAKSTNGNGNKHLASRIKLQPLRLKEFSGRLQDWQQFWDGFCSAVHENEDVATINKFQYLLGLLKGDAALAIAGLPVKAANYYEAIAILTNRFGQRQKIIDSHMDALMNLPSCKESNNLSALRELYDIIEANVRGLQALGIHSESYGALLTTVLQRKLPGDIQIEISRKIGSDDWSLMRLLDILKSELEARERCVKHTSVDVTHASTSKRPHKIIPTASALLSDSNKEAVYCTYCKEKHRTSACSVVTNRPARMEVLKKEGRCFVCLRKGHMASSCFSKYRCNVCKGKHHISLCNADNKSENSGTKQQETQSEPVQAKETTNLFTESKRSILLQTAQGEVFNIDNKDHKIIVKVVFDSGSQRSYVTMRLKDYLNLQVAAREQICLKTFGQSKGKMETMDVTQLGIQDNWRPEEEKVATLVNALVVPYICSPLQRQEIKMTQSTFPHLAGLQLADNPEFDAGSEVDILIGCDESGKFFTGEMRMGEENKGPTAMNTSLGWILSGPGVSVRSKQSGHEQAVATYLLKIDCLTPSEDHQLTKFWDFESIGIRDKETVTEAFEKNITFENGRYSVTLPFKENSPVLPDNYENTLHRFDSTVKRLKKDPKVLEECDSIVKDQLERGIIEPVDTTKPVKVGEVHYLPSQVVTRQDSLATKIRIVFDASSKSNGVCLNDTLHTGPSLICYMQFYCDSEERKLEL